MALGHGGRFFMLPLLILRQGSIDGAVRMLLGSLTYVVVGRLEFPISGRSTPPWGIEQYITALGVPTRFFRWTFY